MGVEDPDRLDDRAQLGRGGLYRQAERPGDGGVRGEGLGAGDRREPRLDDVGLATVVGAIKLPEGRGPRPLHGAERRPVGEEITRLDGGDLADPVERLRKILFAGIRDPLGQGHALVDDVAALFTERLQGPALDRVGHPRAQLVRAANSPGPAAARVERIVLAPLVRKARDNAPAPSG